MPPLPLRRAEDIAGLIKSRREALGLSQQALADRLTVSRKWVNEIEQGNANAKLGLVLRALNELQIDITAHSGPQPKPTTAGPLDAEPEIDIDAIVDRPRVPPSRGRS
ncbi:MAG: helix-turn-helix transcriptional regulator [Alphaproteobacteria bacterium]|nr:helix-turn-helix transcriptional regulator [Alphaproteobacteria bacterium]